MDITKVNSKVRRRLVEDGVYFSEKILGILLHWYQQEVMNDKHRYISMCWSRQLGKTTLLSIKATHYAVTNNKKLIMILSQDRERAKEFYNLVIGHFLSTPMLESMIVGEPRQSETKLVNGTRIINKAAGRDGRSLRGYSVDLLIIDEADFIPDPVFVAGEQCTAAVRGAIWLISTPFKKGTTFHKYFQDGLLARDKFNDPKLLKEGEEPFTAPIGRDYDFKSYHYDFNAGLEAFKPNGDTQLEEAFVKKKKKSMAKWEFDQEYNAIWSDDISSYFNEKQIDACLQSDFCLKPEDYIEYGEATGTYYMGIDFAKHKDKTVITTVKRLSDGTYQVVRVDVWEGRNWDKQIVEINEIATRIRPQKIFIDKTGIGDVMMDFMMNVPTLGVLSNYMQGRIEGIHFGSQMKTTLYSHLQNIIGNKMIHLPHHQDMLDELIFVQYEKTAQSEWVRINAPTGMFDDFPDSLALAMQGSVDDVMYVPVHLQGIRRAIQGDVDGHRSSTASEKNFMSSNGFDDNGDSGDIGDLWEVRQVIEKGAKMTVGNRTFNRDTRSGYTRKHLNKR
jgi:hypothetical protein